MKKSKRILASLMSVLLVLPSAALPFAGTAEGDSAPSAYPNADPSEPYYVVGRFQEKGAVATSASVLEVNNGDDKDQYPKKSSTGQIVLDLGKDKGIDVSAFDPSTLAVALDVTVSRKDGQTGAGKLNSTGNQCLNLWEDKTAPGTRVIGLWGPSDHPYLTSFTGNYGDKAGETVRYLIPWAKYVENNATYVSRLQWFVYNDTYKPGGVYNEEAAVDLDIKIENARIVDTSRDGNGYKSGIVAEWQGSDPVVTQNAQGTHTVTIYPWSSPKTNTMTSEMDTSKLRLEADVMITGDINAGKLEDGQARFSVPGVGEYILGGWSNGKTPKTDTWYHFEWTLNQFTNENNPLTDASKIDRFYLFNYNNDGDKAFSAHVKNVRVVDLTVVEPRENLEAAVNEMADCLFDENDAAVAYDEKVAEGKALLADRDATPAAMTAKVAEINAAKEGLTGVLDLKSDVMPFTAQNYTKDRATPNANHYYYDWKSGDGVTSTSGANLTDDGTALGANRYLQATVTFKKNSAYTGTTNIGELKDLLKNVEVRVRTNIGGEKRTNSYFMTIVGEPTVSEDSITYKMELLFTTEAQNEINWAIVRDSLIMVNTNKALRAEPPEDLTANEKIQWKNNEDIPVYCTLSDVGIVNKTKSMMTAELQQAATEVLENEAQYTADSLNAFKTAQEAAKLVVADNAATARAIRAEIAKVAAAKTALKIGETEPVPENYVPIGAGPVTSNEGHDFGAAIEPEQAIDLTEYADRDLSITFKIKADKTEKFPASIEGNDWLTKITNGAFYVSSQNVVSGLSLSKGIYSGVTEPGVWADVTVALPKTITSISKVEARFFNDLHKLTGNDADQKQGVTISIKDAYVVIGDVTPVARWSGKTGEVANLLDGTRLYTDWGASVDGGSVDLSDGTDSNVANPKYALAATIQVNLKGDSVQGKTVAEVMDKLEYRLRTDGQGEADFYTLTSNEMSIDGNVVTILSPLTNVVTGKMTWSDVRGLNMGYYVKPEYQNKNPETGKPATANPWDQVTMTLSEVKVVEIPVVNYDALNKAIEDAKAKLADGKTYTEASLAALNEKLAAAEALKTSTDQAAVTAAAEALQAAIVGLVEETQPTVDYTALNKAIEDAKAKLADGKTYTEASLAALNEKLAAAEALKTSTDQAAVTAAAEALQAAIVGLVEETQPPVDPSKVPLITEELTSPVQHYMNVYKAFETPVDLTEYAGRELTISFKLRVNKDEATFPASITQEPAVWIKNIVNGTMILWGGSATDDSGKVNMADDLGVAYKMNCGEVGNLLEKIVLGEYIEVTMPVPQAIIDKGSLAKLEIFLYNDLHKLTNVESDQNAGVTISVKDAYLNVGEAQGSKSELKTLLDGKKSAAELAGYTTESVDSYNKLFEDAQAVYDDPDATVAAIASAIASLEAADSVLVPLADNTVMRWSGSEVTKTDMLYGTMFYYDWTPADGVPGSNSSDPGVDLSGKASNGANADYSFTAKVTFNPLEGTTAEQISSMWKVLRFRLRSTTIDGAEKATAFYELTPVDFDGANSFVVNIPLSMFSEVDIDWKNTKDLIVQCEMNDDYKLTEAGPNPHFTMTLSDVKVVNNGVVPPETEKTALKKLIAAAEGLRADLATAGAEEFETALEAARGVMANNNATQADVDEAIADLEAAIEGLVIPWGDLNGKDGVTAEDALLALQAATDKVQLTEDQKYLADVNGDGEVTAEDALLLLQYATQKITTFPVQDLAD